MPRVLISLAFATSLGAMTVWAAVGAAIERPAERSPLLVEIASPLRPTLAITIL
jgi:hypothetical protein